MENIKNAVMHAKEELHDACEYIKAALNEKCEDPRRADKLFETAKEEYKHFAMWHTFAVEDVEKAEAACPETQKALHDVMHRIWDKEHEELMEKAANFKALVAVYDERR